ncbi:hypothetical protein EV421DRAFT_2040614 [Armillaria borealis]|uniref:Uncharacterized protein n=1 Tax=Armillaria borealis TaxID=47425 RepID=A0AA39MGB3_9AGAR|nr:hypothetical protein EV421DRAFT_2040614 [Armillaria borealis]
MSPSIDELNVCQTVTANMLTHGTLVTYDTGTRSLKAMPYPGVKTPHKKVVPVELDKLMNHLRVRGISLGSCICGPKNGDYDKYTSLHLIVCKAGSLPANVGKHILVCANGPHDGCGWFGPVSDMMTRFENQPTFVVHSNRKKVLAWPSWIHIMAGGQKQTLPAPDYHPLPFMSDDDEDDEELKTPVKAEGSIQRSASRSASISRSSSISPMKRSITKHSQHSTSVMPTKSSTHSTPINRGSGSFSVNNSLSKYVSSPLMPKAQKSSQVINPLTPPRPCAINPSTPLSYVDPSTPGSRCLSPLSTELLMALDNVPTPLSPSKSLALVSENLSPEKPSPVLSSYSSTMPKSSPSASVASSAADAAAEDDEGFFGDVSDLPSSSKTIKQLKNHAAIRAASNLDSPSPLLTRKPPLPWKYKQSESQKVGKDSTHVDLMISSEDEGPVKKKQKTVPPPLGPQLVLKGFTRCHQSRCSHTKGKRTAPKDAKARYLNGEGLFYFSEHCGGGHTCPPPIVIED